MDARRRDLALENYARAGYETLPLRGKDAYLKNWQHREPREMWTHAANDANIGLRCGGALHLAVVDADNKDVPQTSERVARFFDGLGLHQDDFPHVATPNAGQHFYIALADERAGAYCQLARDIGAGEFRFGRGAYVAAPPSEIGERTYTLDAGDFAKLPRVALADLRPILARDIQSAFVSSSEKDIHAWSEAPTISRKAWALLRGEGIERYHSRSEHEQAIIASLVNSGHDFDSILSLFLSNPCAGKFAELYAKNPRNATRWLKHSFENAQRWTRAHESEGQRIARAAMQWATSHEWNGRTGAVDRAVYFAHATIAEKCGRVMYAASCRDLAEIAGIGFRTAIRANHRLVRMNLIRLKIAATFNLAALYSLNSRHLETGVRDDTLSNYIYVRECVTTHTCEHDLFRARGLGKTGAQVWQLLNASDTPLRVKDIAAQTGRHRTTICRLLEKMRALGMVTPNEIVGREITFAPVGGVDLNEIARVLRVRGIGAAQRIRHRAERAARRKWSVETRTPKRGKQ